MQTWAEICSQALAVFSTKKKVWLPASVSIVRRLRNRVGQAVALMASRLHLEGARRWLSFGLVPMEPARHWRKRRTIRSDHVFLQRR